ncbi:MAG: ribosome-associated translation inhibitor RaiA [Pyrinomonadaceae bacterium]|nr:ribosome-associated translation inhibitor RaiA [Pyrinomonadaceae bacterium]
MKFDITGRHMDVTPAIKAHVDTQLAKIDGAFDGKPANAHVVIEVERGRHRSEITINWRNDVITANTVDADMYNSISLTVDKIEKQARKLKEKIIDKSHKAQKVATLPTKE